MEILKDFLKPEIMWILVGIILFVLEFALPGLIVFFFGFGACVVGIVCFFAEISINIQLLMFIVVSVGSLLVLRNWLKSTFIGYVVDRQNGSENLDEYLGQRAIVKEKISKTVVGKVEFHGTDWQAQSDEDLVEGDVVEIIAKDNITLKVKSL
ncbi:MAG TPA: NfeD family protein [Sedimentisphaerales bacterium]|nr:NfeD family protein [Sedimentisphaerales bacterium]